MIGLKVPYEQARTIMIATQQRCSRPQRHLAAHINAVIEIPSISG